MSEESNALARRAIAAAKRNREAKGPFSSEEIERALRRVTAKLNHEYPGSAEGEHGQEIIDWIDEERGEAHD